MRKPAGADDIANAPFTPLSKPAYHTSDWTEAPVIIELVASRNNSNDAQSVALRQRCTQLLAQIPITQDTPSDMSDTDDMYT